MARLGWPLPVNVRIGERGAMAACGRSRKFRRCNRAAGA